MADFTAIKTPQPHDGLHHEAPAPVASSATSLKILILRLFITFCVAAFVFGNIATWAPLFEIELVNTFMTWWNGYPNGGGSVQIVHLHHSKVTDTGPYRDISVTGHTEFIRPTFLMLYCIVPFFLSLLAIEALRHIGQARRVTFAYIWRVAMCLRRKPSFPLLGVSRFSWGEWIFGVVFVIGGNALCFYYQWDRRIANARSAEKEGTAKLNTTRYWNILGISCAYLCIYNMAFLLLPVTRNSAWMEFFNISYANGAKLHRWVGYATVITGVIHTVGYWVKWVRDGTWIKYQIPCAHCDLSDEYTGYYAWFNFFGFISVLALVLMIPTSIPIVRRKVYEWFYITHWVLFIIAVFFAILHWSQIIWWIFPAGLLFFIGRATSSWNSFTPVPVQEFSAVGGANGDDEIVKIVITRAATQDYDYKVGNFVYVNVPHLSKLQWHALTIASSPKTNPTELTLLVKPLGDWSKQLLEYAKEYERSGGVAPVVYMDGYYGASLELYQDYPTLLLVGGGIGVTPLLAILEDLVVKVRAQNGVWPQRVVFLWTFRELTLLRALAPVLAALRELDPLEQHFHMHLYATRVSAEATLNEPLNANAFLARTKDPQSYPSKSVATTSPTKARAFYEPLRSSPAFRCVLYIVLFAVATFVLGAAKWGNGAIQGDNNPTLWPLQRAFELAVFTATIVLVYAFIWYEFRTYQHTPATKAEGEDADAENASKYIGSSTQTAFADVHSMRDLVHHLKVESKGERPDMHSLMQQTLGSHLADLETQRSNFALPVVGVIVSGPEALKIATNDAVVTLGSNHFDVHEEEFEL
uniref:FAD-binding FR-type domain-containing protein n=1 Tax=Globisporangium ultimum (strain ATCC 200006 / CBS 805.95 / DAOM BR144) TaxID=431595 RepID=K3WQM6_GLOUD